MTPIVPRVAIFSHTQPSILSFNTSDTYPWFASGFEIHHFTTDIGADILVNNRFNLLVFVGNTKRFYNSKTSKIPTVYLDTYDQITGDNLYAAYSNLSFVDSNPTVSMFTPAYKTRNKFDRLYTSIKEQSFTDWEWIVLDDSPDDNYDYMCRVVGSDHRVKIYKANRCDGLVGSTKRQAASLCNGTYIMEVDHDDELHHLALEACVNAFNKHPDAGFCYSDSAEVFETGGVVDYGEWFGMGEGLHYTYYYKGRFMRPANVPINASTIRHIVGVPNHFRCWRRDIYHEISRHNNKLAIVDDYELLVRTFLKTRMIHIQEPLYIQYMNAGGNNTQEPRRKEIQRLVDRVQKYYDSQIHNRILELGGDDWMREGSISNLNHRSPLHLKRSNLAYEYKIQ
jgi:glycosyltransferase involved in cell wall biosynthesis